MKFLADEDFPKPLVTTIRKFGHSVKTIQQKGLRGASDQTVANIALKEKRIVLTFDKDFLKNQLANSKIILFEFPRTPTSEITFLIKTFVADLDKINMSKDNMLTFSKRGLEIKNRTK